VPDIRRFTSVPNVRAQQPGLVLALRSLRILSPMHGAL